MASKPMTGLKPGDDKPRNATEIAELFRIPVATVRRAVREGGPYIKGFATHNDGHWQRKFVPFDQLRLVGLCVNGFGFRWN